MLAKEDLWFIGDAFLKDSIDALFALKTSAVLKKQGKPYIFNHFNVSGHYVSTGSAIRGLARYMNPLIHGLNEEPILPKYIVITPDVDIIKYLQKAFDGPSTSALVMGAVLHYLICQMDIVVDRRKTDLASKRVGTLPNIGEPKFIWIRMPKRPKTLTKENFNLRGKFNSILEERLFDSAVSSHYIMSIEVPPKNLILRAT